MEINGMKRSQARRSAISGWTSRKRYIVASILATNSLTAAMLTFLGSKVYATPANTLLGLPTYAPAVYWASVAMALGALLVSMKGSKLAFLSAGLLLFSTWEGLPSLLLSSAYRLDAHYIAALATATLTGGPIDIGNVGTSYLQFPGFILNGAVVSCLLGLGTLSIAQWAPALWSGLFFLGFSVLVFRVIGENTSARLAAILGSFGCAWLQFHFAPQAAALFLFPLLLALLLVKTFSSQLAAIVIGTWMSISHPPSILIVFSLLAAQWILRSLPISWIRKMTSDHSSLTGANEPRQGTLLSLWGVLAIWIAWILFIAGPTFINAIALVGRYLTSEGAISASARTPDLYVLTSSVRLLALGFVGAVWCFSFLALALRYSTSKGHLLTAAWLVGEIPFALVVLPVGLLDRAYMFFFLGGALAMGDLRERLKSPRLAGLIVAGFVVASIAAGATAYRDSNQYIVPPRWAGSESTQFRFLDSYLGPACQPGAIAYVDTLTTLWTTARYGNASMVDRMAATLSNGSQVYSDGTTNGYIVSCAA